MTDKEKLLKLRKLANAMYYAAQYLTTDASRLHKAMDEYHQFIINEYHKKEPTIPDIVDEHFYEMLDEEPVSKQKLSNSSNIGKDCKEEPVSKEFKEVIEEYATKRLRDPELCFEYIYFELINAIKYGINLQKQQMMSKAIDGEIGYWNLRGLSVNVDLPLSAEEGDKVKVIVIEKD